MLPTGRAEREAEERRQPLHRALGVVGIFPDQSQDRIQRVGEKMGLAVGVQKRLA